MPATYEPIATTTLGSAAANITFSSIGSGYTDLRLVFVLPANAGGIRPALQFNSDAGSNYSHTQLMGNGTAASSTRKTSQTSVAYGETDSGSTTPSFYTYDVFSYAGSTNKTLLATLSNDKNGSGSVERIVGLWRNTSAITAIKVIDFFSQNFPIDTTATLYGILKA